MLHDHFPHFTEDVLAPAHVIFETLFPRTPLQEWEKNGTWIEYWEDDVRIAFAVRQSYCSLHFQDRFAPRHYLDLGGTNSVGAVTIRLPLDMDWDPDPVRRVLAKILGREP